MAREVLGTLPCPECGGAAEVKRTKAGLGYRWCMDCHAQYFPRTAEASDRLIAKCGGGTVPAPVPAPKADPQAAKPAPAPAKPKAKPPAPTPAAPALAPAKKPAGVFDFLMK